MKHVLIIDNDPIVRETLATVLIRGGFSVQTAQDMGQAGICLQNFPFDLVVLNCNSQNAEETEIIIELQTAFPQLPVLLLTNGLSLSIIQNCQFDKVIGYLDKPFDPKKMLLYLDEIFWMK